MITARRDTLLSLSAVVEGATGLALLVVPTVLPTLLFGSTPIASQETVMARICGAALLAFAAAIWGARRDNRRHGPVELLFGLTLYNCLVTTILIYAALVLKMIGILLWPVMLFHAAISIWCFLVLRLAARG